MPTTRRPGVLAAPRMRESAFRDAVVHLATLRGWMTYFTWRSDHSPKGFPDLIFLRGDRMVVAELKVGTNTPSAEQEAWLAAFRLIGAEVFVWRPEDWTTIEEVLAA